VSTPSQASVAPGWRVAIVAVEAAVAIAVGVDLRATGVETAELLLDIGRAVDEELAQRLALLGQRRARLAVALGGLRGQRLDHIVLELEPARLGDYLAHRRDVALAAARVAEAALREIALAIEDR
jgi:hypothetical protein